MSSQFMVSSWGNNISVWVSLICGLTSSPKSYPKHFPITTASLIPHPNKFVSFFPCSPFRSGCSRSPRGLSRFYACLHLSSFQPSSVCLQSCYCLSLCPSLCLFLCPCVRFPSRASAGDGPRGVYRAGAGCHPSACSSDWPREYCHTAIVCDGKWVEHRAA